jgi:hypothetical protein
MALTNVTGFYVNVGSLDFPAVANWDKPFGYNEGSLTPIYSYSILDVKNTFADPVQYLRDNPANQSGLNSLLICDAYNNPDIKTQDINSHNWTLAFKVLNAVYMNQAIWNVVAPNPELYASLGDQELSTNQAYGGYGDESNAAFYRQGSLTMRPGKTNRLFDFSLDLKLSSGYVSFHIYLDPDYLLSTAGTGVFKVYMYEDTDNDDRISDTEFDAQIMAKLHTILKTGKYKRYDKYETTRQIKGGEGEEDYRILQAFYVFSNYAEEPLSLVTRNMLTVAVKEYLLEKYPSTDDFDRLIWEYPELFTQSTVDIFPCYNNTLTGVSLGDISRLHPVSPDVIKSILSRNACAFDPATPGFRPYEIFYIGSAAVNNYVFNYPLIAVEDITQSAVKRPISARFPDYVPKFGYDMSNIDTDSARFHHFIILAMNLVTGLIDVNEIPDEFKSMNWTIKTDPVDTYVAFTYKNIIWKIKGNLA